MKKNSIANTAGTEREIAVIAFDADDTLWHNENLFAHTQERFRELLKQYHDGDWIDQRLYETEMENLRHFGYGIKGFVLSMIETAIQLTEGRIGGKEIQTIIDMGKEMITAPVELLEGVAETIPRLADEYQLLLITKGDLFHQEAKIARSGIADYFAVIEIVSEKDEATYRGILDREGIDPKMLLMVGNSLRSDILPVVALGGQAVHIPYHLTWAHEAVEKPSGEALRYHTLESISQLPGFLARLPSDPGRGR